MNGNRGGGRVEVTGDGQGLVSLAGGQLLSETARATGLGERLCTALAPWRRDRARHDPGKVALDLTAVKTHRIPSITDRSGTRERPPGPRPGGRGGISGATTAHSSSLTSRRGGEEVRVDMTVIVAAAISNHR